jgi:hypothetical protein
MSSRVDESTKLGVNVSRDIYFGWDDRFNGQYYVTRLAFCKYLASPVYRLMYSNIKLRAGIRTHKFSCLC